MSEILLSTTSYRSMMADEPRPKQDTQDYFPETRAQNVISRATSVPTEFYHTEFLEYSKETYERKTGRTRRKRTTSEDEGASNTEIRRQIHIQSEQRRRAQIKDGFDELKGHLPGCANKKMSKAALLTKTVQQLQHLKNMQQELLCEVERLSQENDSLKKFQHEVFSRQSMDKMYIPF
ncbi:Myc-type, basic helix-loop-helix domain-containing protein [Sporodiniella umbellata]|nr:Myc-type, basic helix-loop-helix domain-containing protein [Sporodiniella umbellata]